MTALALDVFRWGTERIRTGPWRGDPEVAVLAPVPGGAVPSAAAVGHCLELLAGRGVRRVVTAALSEAEQVGFAGAGLTVTERLHLLSIDLHEEVPAAGRGVTLRRAGTGLWPTLLEVDAAAFSGFWRFDGAALREAVDATPRTRVRAAMVDDGVAGYAVSGRAGTRGFVQRLAVRPERHRQGVGRALLLDGLRWMQRRGVQRAVVNTQVGNRAALRLYLSAGFRPQAEGLAVLTGQLG